MANDSSITTGNVTGSEASAGDSVFDHGAGADSLFGTVQLAQANGAAAPAGPGQTIQVAAPQGTGPVVIRVEVTPGSTIDLPQPFEADAAFMAKEGDGNLAIRVGDVTVILQGYVEANSEQPVTIEGADNQPIDIATILASTDPAIDIQTAAGPDAGQNGQGADNTGAILSQLADGNGLGGFEGAGAQDGTELGYRTIDASIRNDFADPLAASTTTVFGFSVNGFGGAFQEGFLRDPAQTSPFSDSEGTFFDTFLHEYRDAVEHPGQAMFAGWADFHGTGVTQNNDFGEYLSQTSKTATVTVTFTNGTGDLVLTNIGDGVTSNGSHLSVQIKDDGHTMFVRRDEATATDSGNALVAVVHVEGPHANGTFTIETILINRIDHHQAGNDTMDLDIQFTVYDGPAPKQQPGSDIPNEGSEGGDVPEGPTSPSMPGHLTATFRDDVPILDKVTYINQHDGSMAAREGVEAGGSDHGLIDEDWLKSGAKDIGADGNSNAGDKDTGDTGGGTCVTGAIKVNFGADGGANWDGATEKATQAEKHAFTLDTAQYLLGKAFPYGADGLTSGGKPLVVLSVDGDHVTVGIADEKQSQKLAEGEEGDTSGEEPTGPTDPIPGCTIFTLTLDQATGAFKFELKGPLDHGDSIFGNDDGVSELVADQPENTIPLQFGVTAMDDDGDKIHVDIDIDVNDDMPVARNDTDHVAKGSHDAISGNVMTGADTDTGNAGKDSQGADHAQVVAIVAGDVTGLIGKDIQGQYGKLVMNADGSYTYTRDAYTPGGVDDSFEYTLKDGDGDISKATLTIHIDNAGVCVEVPSDASVSEAGLPDGSNPTADSEFTEGTITIKAGDGIKSLEIGGETLDLAALKDLNTTHKEIADDPKGTLTLTGFNESTGELTYTYELKHNTDANNTSSTSFDIKVTDTDGQEGTATLQINIVDDEPTAVCDTLKLDAPKEPTADVQFVLDISGSMKDQYANVPGNTYPDNRIGLERYAVEQMLTKHPEIQNVQIVLFDDHASHSEWMTRDEALAWIKEGNNFNGQGGNTNFDEALKEAMEGFVETRPLTHGDQTLVYFFSDGNPNEPRDEGITNVGDNDPNNVSVKEWTDFVNAHDISNVFGVGIPGIAGHLAPIAYPDGSGNAEPNQIGLAGGSTAQLGDLLDTLTDTIVPVVTPIHGDLTDNDTPGADDFGDGKLVSVTYDGNTLTFADNSSTQHIDLGAGRGSIDIKGDGTYTYNPPAKDADGTPFEIEYKIQDSDGDTSTAKLKIDINTRPEVDLNGAGQGADGTASFVEVFGTATGSQGAIQIAPNGTITEDGPLIASMTVTLTNRLDGGAESLSLNAAAQNLIAQTGGTVTWSYNAATGELTITGNSKPGWYESFLQGVTYNNTSDTPNTTPRHVTVVVKDYDPDTGTSLTGDTHSINISVTPTNDAPTADITHDFAATEDTWVNLSGKVANLANMVIGDPDSAGDDVYVTLSVTQGKLDVSVGSTGVSIVSGDNTGSVTIKGNIAEINNLLKESGNGSVKYLIENNSPTGHVTLTLSVNDDQQNGQGSAQTAFDTATINVTNVADKPVTDLNGNYSGSDNSASFTEDGSAVKIAPNGTISDEDSANMASMTVTITNLKDGTAESLSVSSAYLPAGVTASYANGVLTIQGSASTSVYQAILQHIVYNNSSQAPNGSDRTVTVVVNDGTLNSISHSVTVEVNPVNDAPTATALQNGLSVQAGADIGLAGKGLSIADIDAGSDTMTVKLSVGEGELTVTKGGANVNISYNGNHDLVTITGSQSEINKVLTGVTGSIVYNDDDNSPSSSTKLTMTVNDNGNNGDGGSLSTTVQTTIGITPPNQKPETDLNGSSKYGADNAASFTEDQGAVAISPSGTVKDDSGTVTQMKVTLSSTPDGAAESLSVSAAYLPAGVTAVYANGVLTVNGSASTAVYQAILQHIMYNNSSQAPDGHDRTATVVVNDGALNSTSHSVTIEVNPVNDAPTATALQSGLSVNEQVSLSIAGKGLSVADVDAGSDNITVKLSVDDCGVLNASKGSANVSISGSGTDTVTIYGSQSEINKLLSGTTGSLTFKDDTDTPNASVTLKMTVNDNGNNGDGGSLSASVQTSIAINAINDAPTVCDDNVYTNAGTTQINIAEWMLLRNDSDPDTDSSKFDLISGNSAVANVTGSTVSHDNGSGTDGVVKFTDTNGNSTDSKFDYTMTDGSGGNATGHVTVHQDTSGTLTASSGDDIVIVHPTTATTVDAGAGDDIVVGGAGNDKLDGGADDDLIFGGAGNDSLIYSSDANSSHDQYDGGTGFDRIEVTGAGVDIDYDTAQFKNIEMFDLGDANNRSGSSNQNEFALNAHDLMQSNFGTVGSGGGAKQISMFVIGDENGGSSNSSSNKDIVDLTGFTATGTTGSFTDTSGTHQFTVYAGLNAANQTVNVAVETGLVVHTH